MKIAVTITDKNPSHTRLSIWVNEGLICDPGGICLRNDEVHLFLARLKPQSMRDITKGKTSGTNNSI